MKTIYESIHEVYINMKKIEELKEKIDSHNEMIKEHRKTIEKLQIQNMKTILR
jgi:hypothetical protein